MILRKMNKSIWSVVVATMVVVAAPGAPAVNGADGEADLTLSSGKGISELGFTALNPFRILDTRNGTGAPQAPVDPGATLSLEVTDVGEVPEEGVEAVALNVTVTEPTAESFITVWPTGSPRPLASSLNMVPGETTPNLVIAKVGDAGMVDFYNHQGQTHLVADVVGYFGTSSFYEPLSPARLLDTRQGTGRPGGTAGKVGGGSSIDLKVTGRGGVPASGVSSVVLNVTVTEPTRASFVTVWPTGQPRPTASSLNMVPGQTTPNLVIAKVGAGGRVSLFNNAGGAHLVADVVGYFPDTAYYDGLTPARLLDTRQGTGRPGGTAGKVGGGSSIDLKVTGRGGVPVSGVSSVVLNVTVTEPTTGSFVTVWPAGQPRPTASSLNMVAGQTTPNLVIAKVGAGGHVSLYNNAGETHLVADVVGYFGAPTRLVGDLEPSARDSCGSEGAVSVDGIRYDNSFTCSLDQADTDWREYLLNRKYDELYVTVGQDDTSAPMTKTVRFRVFGDGAEIAVADVGYGTSENLRVDVSNVVTLRLQAQILDHGADSPLADVFAAFAQPLLSRDGPVVVPMLNRAIGPDRAIVARDLDQVDDAGCHRASPISISGARFLDSFACSLKRSDLDRRDYILGRDYETLSVTIGQADDSVATSKRIAFRVFGDGRELADVELARGVRRQLDLDVTGVLRVSFQAEIVDHGTEPVARIAVAGFGEPVARR